MRCFRRRERSPQRVECRPRIADERQRAELVGVARRDIDAEERHVRVLELGVRGRREVGETCADGDHQIGFERQPIGGQSAVRTDRRRVPGMVPGQRALAGLRLADGDAQTVGEVGQRGRRFGVDAPRRRR